MAVPFNKTINTLLVISAIFFQVGCLQTRSHLRGQEVTTQQKAAAEAVVQKEDKDREFRELYGRIETVENQLNQVKDNEKVKTLEARLAQTETELNLLKTTVSELNAKAKKEAQYLSSDERALFNKKSETTPLATATKLFNDKKWEDAILAFEEYRKGNPKGKEYADATLKIGLCFQNMGLKDDAKVFFKEVVEKYPKSKEADTAKSKLKKL